MDPNVVKWIGGLTIATLAISYFWLEARRRNRAMTLGQSVKCWIVMANRELYGYGERERPALVLFCFAGPHSATEEQQLALVELLRALRQAEPANDAERIVARWVRDERYKQDRRQVLPEAVTDGCQVYLADVLVNRRLLPQRKITLPYIYCKAIPGDKGGVWMTDYPEETTG